MRERHPLPTKAEIQAITDPQDLRDLLDDIERTTTSIETQLEFDELGDDDWYARARGALIAHRITAKMATRRLHVLQSTQPGARSKNKPPAPTRDADENHPLTNEVLKTPPVVEIHGAMTREEVDAKLLWVVERINAVEADRSSEIGVKADQRDEGFLAVTKGVLRPLKAIRLQLESRKAGFRHRAKAERVIERETTRERMFIDAARDALPRETFLAIWAAVDRKAVEDSVTGRAA